MKLVDLHAAIEAVCPIIGVCQTATGSYVVNYAATATEAQKAEAQKIIADPSAVEAALAAKLNTLTAALASVIAEINGKYAGLSITADDTISAAATKMIESGVIWSDVDTYGARLKLLYDAINELK